MAPKKDFTSLIGKIFTKLTVISHNGSNIRNQSYWLCKCDCGKEISVRDDSLKIGGTTSCGCTRRSMSHGHARGGKMTTELQSWTNAKRRCLDKKDKRYSDYGGRGITIFPEWVGEGGFAKFLAFMGPKPSPEHSLDRYPNNETGHYEPGNVRWGTDEQQSRNKRNNRWIEYDGKRMILADWAKAINVKNEGILSNYIKRNGMAKAVDHYKYKV